MGSTATANKLDAPEAGYSVGDHVSWPLRLDASYNDGRGVRGCGEISLLGYEGSVPIAHIDVHDRLHRATGTMRPVNRRRLRRESSVSEPTTTAAEGAPVREAAPSAAMHRLAVVVRETTGHVVPPQPTVHQQQQQAKPMSSSAKWLAPRRSTSSSAGNLTPVRASYGPMPAPSLTASVREAAGDLAPKEPLGWARAYASFQDNIQSGRR